MKKVTMILSIVLVLLMIFGAVNFNVFAEENLPEAPDEGAEIYNGELISDENTYEATTEASKDECITKIEGVDYTTDYCESVFTNDEIVLLEKAYGYNSVDTPYDSNIIGEAYNQYGIPAIGDVVSVTAAPSNYTELSIPSTTTVTTTSSQKIYYKIVPSVVV